MTLTAVLLTACGQPSAPSTSPSRSSTPAPTSAPAAPSGYEGDWQGTGFQGLPVAFSVTPDQRVTAITTWYSLPGGCRGTRTFSNLSLGIAPDQVPTHRIFQGPMRPGVPMFVYQTGRPGDRDYTEVFAWFTSSRTAEGVSTAERYTGCESSGAGGSWHATRP